jgi:hypothetical protein
MSRYLMSKYLIDTIVKERPWRQAQATTAITWAKCATVLDHGPSAYGPGRQTFEARPALWARRPALQGRVACV